MSSCSSLVELPPEVLSNILTWFSDGKSISTFAIVAKGSTSFVDLHLIQYALTHRFKTLAHQLEEQQRQQNQDQEEEEEEDYEEIHDVLMVLGEEIRTHESFHEDGNMKQLSEYCAILDYFEQQLQQQESLLNGGGLNRYVVWTGPIETQFGIVHAQLQTTSRNWTPTALHYWYNDFELYQFSLATPLRSPPVQQQQQQQPYGSFVTVPETRDVWKRVLHNLNEEEDELGRYALVPRHLNFEADPSIFFTKRLSAFQTSFIPNDKSMKCYWDQEDGYDWEEGIARLGEHVIRILQRLGPAFPTQEYHWVEWEDEDEEDTDSDEEDEDESE